MDSKPQETLWTRDFALLCASSLMSWFCCYLLMPTVPKFASEYLGLGGAQVGMVSSAMTITSMLARPFAGYALDRWGRRWVHIASLLAFSGVVFAFGGVQGLAAMLLLRMLQGVPFGFSTTASSTVAADLVPADRRGEGMGYFSLTQTLTMAVAPGVALSMMGGGQFTHVFRTASVFALCAALLAWALRHPRVRNPKVVLSLRGLLDRRVLGIAATTMFVALGYSGVLVFATLYAAERGIANVGVFFTVYSVGTFLSRTFSGRVFDRHGPRLIVGGSLGLLCAGYAAMALCGTEMAFLAVGGVLGIAMGAVVLALQTMSINVVPAGRRGAAIGTLWVGFDLGMATGASVLGAVAQAAGTYATMYLTIAGVMVIPALLFFVVVMPRYRPIG